MVIEFTKHSSLEEGTDWYTLLSVVAASILILPVDLARAAGSPGIECVSFTKVMTGCHRTMYSVSLLIPTNVV